MRPDMIDKYMELPTVAKKLTRILPYCRWFNTIQILTDRNFTGEHQSLHCNLCFWGVTDNEKYLLLIDSVISQDLESRWVFFFKYNEKRSVLYDERHNQHIYIQVTHVYTKNRNDIKGDRFETHKNPVLYLINERMRTRDPKIYWYEMTIYYVKNGI